MAGQLGYFALPSNDPQASMVFYGGLFGWQFDEESEHGGHHILNTAEPFGCVGGARDGVPTLYFTVDDIHEAVKRVRELGGEADEPVLRESGWDAACRDSQGLVFNLWQAT
ncbi:hypothetical protein FHU36_004340 [Nonomuraea muscovyensis]|uniref:VOC domain-containing protein n=1 Tax=Nonomuraea muscovyensis TaxID=1124761 RepID=A0A7X0F0F4_9ACTN|nr:VOC family protein [Nonomuraea muscovyensis]MBB6347795.1 hypothetical protein [Nonomuraea muscovyensis]